MRVSTQDYHDVTVVEIQGEIDGDAAEVLSDTITGIIADGRIRLVIDMSNVGSMDGQGLETLLWARDYCRQHRAQLRLAGLDETCEKILEITRLKFEFDQHAELAEAVKSFA